MFADEHIERLISRSLDGELTEPEELELARALLRSRDARDAYEQSEDIDRWAGQAMRAALQVEPPAHGKPRAVQGSRPSPRARRAWPMAAAAVAAAIAAAWMLWPDATRNPPLAEGSGAVAPATTEHSGLKRNQPLQPVPGGRIPRVVDHRIARDLIAVEGRDGRIYWIELDRRRTLERPRSTGNVRQASDDL